MSRNGRRIFAQTMSDFKRVRGVVSLPVRPVLRQITTRDLQITSFFWEA